MAHEPASTGSVDFPTSLISISDQPVVMVDDIMQHVTLTQYGDKTIYEGTLVDDKPEGHGFCVFPSGVVCVGNFSSGLLNGRADVLLPSGALFSGVFRRSVANGNGVCLQKKQLARGTWQDGGLVQRTWKDVSDDDLMQMYARVAEVLKGHRLTLTTASVVREPFQECQHGKTALMNEPLVILPGERSMTRICSLLSGNSKLDIAPMATQTRAPSPSLKSGLASAAASVQEDMEGSFSYTMMKRQAIPANDHKRERPSAKSVLTSKASPQAIFASAAPAANEFFSTARFLKYCAMFLFPFLSLPQLPFSLLRSVTLETEREFVVSGATLLHRFDPPVFSLCIAAAALCCHVAAVVIVVMRVDLGAGSEGRVTHFEVIVPFVLWVLQACVNAGYNSYIRVAHGLERLDRSLTPKLSAFAASLVDTKASICIYTWADEGRSVAINRRHRYSWLALSLLVGILMGFAAPITRMAFRRPLFGGNAYEVAATVLITFSTLCFSSAITYCVLKLTDMQRQVREQMRVLTRLAYLEGKCMMRPSEFLNNRFNFEEPLNVNDVFSGVVGWYMMRSLVLYTSMCSNHTARNFAMSIFIVPVLCCLMAMVVNASYLMTSQNERSNLHYSNIQSYALVLCFTWGLMLLRHLCVCVSTVSEHVRHLYLLNVASLYHRTKHESPEGCGEIIATCREMVKEYDQFPTIFSFLVAPVFLVLVVVVYALALSAVMAQLCISIQR